MCSNNRKARSGVMVQIRNGNADLVGLFESITDSFLAWRIKGERERAGAAALLRFWRQKPLLRGHRAGHSLH